jgi:hypothetical protein
MEIHLKKLFFGLLMSYDIKKNIYIGNNLVRQWVAALVLGHIKLLIKS